MTTPVSRALRFGIAVLLLGMGSRSFAQTIGYGPLLVTLAPLRIDTVSDTAVKRGGFRANGYVAALRRARTDDRSNDAGAALSEVIPKRVSINVSGRSCSQAEFFYEPANRRVVLCYEFVDVAQSLALRAAEFERAHAISAMTDSEARVSADQFLVFGVLHEAGHALIHQYRLPVLGGEEAASDGFATYVLLSSGRSEWAIGTYWWFQSLHAATISAPEDYSDPHLLPAQRAARLSCLISGFHGNGDAQCVADWQQLSAAWKSMLGGIAKQPH
jgi:hypothetical protein